MIHRVEFSGNRRMDTAALLPYLTLKVGDRFSADEISRSIKALHQTGYFDRIDVESDPLEGGVALTFVAHERPFLTEVTFEGNRHVGSDKLKERIDAKTHTFLDPQKIQDHVQQIKKYYEEEAYYHARVASSVRALADDQAAVVFQIDEGERARVRSIRFSGNHAFDEKTLRKQIKTAPHFWLTSWWTQSDRYQDDVIAADVDRLREFYLNHGHLQVEVERPQVTVSPDQKAFDLVFVISEGEAFRIGKIALADHTHFDTSALMGLLQGKEGEIANRGRVREDGMRLIEFYGEHGYLFADAAPEWTPGVSEGTVNLTYRIKEGEEIHVREVHIAGNEKTRDWVIRRELRFNEQERLDTRLLRRSYQRLQNLNFFEEIDLVPQPVTPGWVDVDIRVKEKLTGVFSIGGNYSSEEKFGAVTDVTLGNLFGRGQLLRVKAELGKRRTTYSLSLKEPYLFGSEVSGTAEVFNHLRDLTGSYEEKRKGGGVTLGRAFGEYESASLSYTLEHLEIFDVQADAPQIIRDQAGESVTSALGVSLVRDTRDFIFDPKEGGRSSLVLEYAGTVLGGDNDYMKAVADTGRFFPLWRDHVFSLHGRVGYASGIGKKDLPVGERFFVGGINTLRGFKFGKAGPTDAKTGESIGGNKELLFNAEYLVPLVPAARIKAVLFYDYGQGFGDADRITFSHLRQTAGVGIRWISPIGPLRWEWGRNLRPQKGERQEVIDFSIGTLF